MILFYIFACLLIFIIGLILAKLLPLNRYYQLFVMCSIIACAGLIYYSVGSLPQLRQLELKQQEKARVATLLQSMDGKQGLIKRLEQRLNKEPDSAQGHYLLAKLLASEGQWQLAVIHFRTAKSIEADNVNYQVNYAHALWQLNHNQFNDEIRQTFKGLLDKNPDQIDALNMLAMDAYQQKHYKKAITYWRTLLRLAPPNSQDAQTIEDAIQKAQNALNG